MRPRISTAEVSADGLYRYVLRRPVETNTPGSSRCVVFVMLNPSTADATKDDPTIRKCLGFAMRWGFPSLAVVNLFAWRATKPESLRLAADPVGPRNDARIREVTSDPFASVIVAWGRWGEFYARRVAEVAAMLPAVRCLGTTKGGSPLHPLMVPYSACPQPWEPAARSSGGAAE